MSIERQEFKQPHSPLGEQLLKEMLAKPSGNKILEIGAKELGRDSIYFAQEGNDVVLTDMRSLLERVKGEVGERKLDGNIQLVISNPEKLALKNETFDAVFSLATLDSTYLPDSFKEIYRVLKPKGGAIVMMYKQAGGRVLQDTERIKKWITESGLNIIDCWDIEEKGHTPPTIKSVFKLNKEQNEQEG